MTVVMLIGATETVMGVSVASVIMADTINLLTETDVFIINTNNAEDNQFPSVLNEK